jgi:hypothetical protein
LNWIVGGIVLVACVVGQIMLFPGPQPFDPAYYFQIGVDYPHIAADWWSLRIGLIGPIRLAVLVFGVSELALYAVPFAAGLLLAASVYVMMLVFFRDRVLAAAAALVTVLNANYLLQGLYLFPDTIATATFTAGMLCLVLGRKRSEDDGRRWRPDAAALAAGFLFGWSYLIREFSPILAPAVVAAVVLLRYPLRRVAVLTGAAVTTAALELLYGFVQYHDPLIRIHTLLERRAVSNRPARQHLFEALRTKLNDPLDGILVLPRLLLTWNVGWVFLLLIALFAVALVRCRDRRLWLLAAWFFGFWAAMAGLALWRLPSGDLVVNVTNIRYWYPLLPPLAMGAFGGLYLLLRGASESPRRARLAQVVAVSLSALALVPGSIEFKSCAAKDVWRNEPSERWDELRSWFATPASQRYDVVWTDKSSQRLLIVYTRSTFGSRYWRGQVERLPRRLRGSFTPPNPSRALILVQRNRVSQLAVDALRRDWAPVFESRDRRLVLLVHMSSGRQASTGVDAAWWRPPPARGPGVKPGTCGLSPYAGG